MRKIICILAGFLLSIFSLQAQGDKILRKISSDDSLNISVKFERVKLSREELNTTVKLNTLLENSVKTTDVLSQSLNRLTTAVEQNIQLSQLTKADIVAQQLGVTREEYNKYYKRNNSIVLISLIPALLLVFWSMTQFLTQKGLNVNHALIGTGVMTLYGLIGSGILYMVLSLVLNKQYFIIKDLMNSLF